jgi:hypothetical protein
MRSKHLALVAIATTAVGCHKGDPFVGTWKATYSASGMSIDETETNSADGTFTSHSRATKGNAGRALLIDDKGTWRKISDTRYDKKLTDTNWSPEGGSAASKARIADRFSQNKGRILAAANKEPVKVIKWQGNDEFTESTGTQPVTFHRAP